MFSVAITEDHSTKWFGDSNSNDDLIKELLDNETPFFVLPHTFQPQGNHSSHHLFPESTGQGIQSLPSITSRNNESVDQKNIFQTRIEEKVATTSRIDNKYTLKIKSCGTEMSDDGYKWRKYGQKSIKNSPHPRSYYRCTNPRCSAKKQVERSSQDPDTLVVTYEGLHLHFTYTHFLLNQIHLDLTHPPTKKSKTITRETQNPQIHEAVESVTSQTHKIVTQEFPILFETSAQEELWEVGSQGLLEDIVPLVIRRPSSITTSSNPSSNSSSYPSSTPSSSSLTCSPNNSDPW